MNNITHHSNNDWKENKTYWFPKGPDIKGAIHSAKISGNFGPKLNWSARSNRTSFEKTGVPFEVDHFSRSDWSEFWLNGSHLEVFFHNPNIQVVITHASHVSRQHSLGLPLRMNGMQRIQFEFTFGPSITCNLIMCVLTFYHVKLVQSTALEQKCFDLWSLSPALYNVPKLSIQQWQK